MKNKKCKNCDQPLNGGYCSNCGQRDIELLKFKKLIKDFFDHHLDLDSRIFRTIKYLMFRPGFLTIEYWNGRRARYVPPFKIYLLTSFLYFMVLSLNTNNQVVENDIVETKIEKNIDNNSDEYDYFESYFSFMQKNLKIVELILLLPLTALGLQLINRKIHKLYFSHNFIASIHLSSGWFIIDTIIELLIWIFPKYSMYLDYLEITSLIYLTFVLRNIYNMSTIRALFKTIFLMAFILFFIILFLAIFVITQEFFN